MLSSPKAGTAVAPEVIEAASTTRFAEEVLQRYQAGAPFLCAPTHEQASALPLAVGGFVATRGTGGWIAPRGWSMPDDDRLAQVTFTSGTEGARKGILLSAGNLSDVVSRLRAVQGVDDTLSEYLGVPPYYSFGLGRLRLTASVGGRLYIPEHGFNPLEAAEMLAAGQINSISAVPSLWRLVLNAPHLFDAGRHRLRWIEIGSQYMSAGEKKLLRELFPQARIVQHYGLTEASRSTFLDISEASDAELETVGCPTGSVEIRCSSDERIEIRGPHVAAHAIIAGERVALPGPDGWLRTSDRGVLRGGYLDYLGRADFIINCGGQKISPDVLEAAMLARLPNAPEFAVTRLGDPVLGENVGVAVAGGRGDLAAVEQAAREALAQEFGVTARSAVAARQVDAIPRTETGKVQRAELARRLSPVSPAGAAPAPSPAPATPAAPPDHDPQALEATLVAIWRSSLNVADVSIDATFYDHGGDSLSSISLLLAIERAGLDRSIANRIFNGETIRSIAHGDAADKPAARVTERDAAIAINSTRGLFVLLLIAIHFTPGLLPYLPVDAPRIDRLLEPVYRLGTPSFAMAFGLGIGYFYIPQMLRGSIRILPRILISCAIVAAGIAILGTTRLLIDAQAGGGRAPMLVRFLYSVLLYYMLALPSIPLWARLLRIGGKVWQNALLLMVACLGIHFLIQNTVPSGAMENPLLQTAKLMIKAKYNYFFMTALVMAGVAAGAHMHEAAARWREASSSYFRLGPVLVALGLLVTIDLERLDYWFRGIPTLAALTLYAGLVITTLAAVAHAADAARRRTWGRWAVASMCACGVLSLPMYVGHSLVIPIKDVISSLGVPGAAALVLSLTGFAIISFFAIRRVATLFL